MEKEQRGCLKGIVLVPGERSLIFELNSQSNDNPPSHAPKATCWLAVIVYGSVWAPFVCYHLQSQDCAGAPDTWACKAMYEHTIDGQAENREETFTEFDV